MYFKFYVDVSECASEETVTTASLPAGNLKTCKGTVFYNSNFIMLLFSVFTLWWLYM